MCSQVEVIFDDDIEEEALLNQVMDDHEDPIMLEHGPVDGLEVRLDPFPGVLSGTVTLCAEGQQYQPGYIGVECLRLA